AWVGTMTDVADRAVYAATGAHLPPEQRGSTMATMMSGVTGQSELWGNQVRDVLEKAGANKSELANRLFERYHFVNYAIDSAQPTIDPVRGAVVAAGKILVKDMRDGTEYLPHELEAIRNSLRTDIQQQLGDPQALQKFDQAIQDLTQLHNGLL